VKTEAEKSDIADSKASEGNRGEGGKNVRGESRGSLPPSMPRNNSTHYNTLLSSWSSWQAVRILMVVWVLVVETKEIDMKETGKEGPG
jgi:hypothetical protein